MLEIPEEADSEVIQNLGSSLLRVKAMVVILYDRNNLTFEKVSKLALIVNLKLKLVSEDVPDTLAFASLEEVTDFLINKIL
ncbi:hypothetical protein QT972_09685 [Microcoleus sp. herbarium7]|uniref:hypothetical protein n=1 Tax=Microcoleus sp. herbarium7 TaxID=3055435 RepID=UPI002FD34DA6